MSLMDATQSELANATSEQPSEQWLLAQSAAGNAAALQSLIEQHRPSIARLARRLLAWPDDVDDVVQDVFVTLIEQAGRFRGQSSVRTWLTSITLNRCRTLRRRWHLGPRASRAAAMQPRHFDSPDQSLGVHEERLGVRRAMSRLHARDREVLVLHYLEELSLDRMAEL